MFFATWRQLLSRIFGYLTSSDHGGAGHARLPPPERSEWGRVGVGVVQQRRRLDRHPFMPVSATLSMMRRRRITKITSIGRTLSTDPAISFP